jgi:hypothetical protein
MNNQVQEKDFKPEDAYKISVVPCGNGVTLKRSLTEKGKVAASQTLRPAQDSAVAESDTWGEKVSTSAPVMTTLG